MGSRSPQDPNLTTTAPYYQPLRAYPNSSLNGHGYEAADDEYAIAQQLAPQAPMYPGAPQGQSVLDTYATQNQHGLPDQQLDSHDQFAGLLEAVKSVGQEEAASQGGAVRNLTRSMGATEQGPADGAYGAQQGRTKRKRRSSGHTTDFNDEDDDDFSTGERATRPTKRTKRPSVSPSTASTPTTTTTHHPSANTDATRALPHVHSAAALFRAPSAHAAKKYTRPPMSKLYASLNLSPENFLHLQAAAKQYMLDPQHPERQNCVGNRGKGDTDMVKLRLFNCVRDFLAGGEGERFFGEDAGRGEEGEGETGKRWVWPRDGNKIVSLVTPLLRRMVTNERQRQYAVETRKGGAGKKGKGGAGSNDGDTSMLDHTEVQQQQQDEGQWSAETGQPTLDPELGQVEAAMTSQQQHRQHPGVEPTVQIYVLRGGEKLLPRLDVVAPPTDAPGSHPLPFAELRHIVEQQLHGLPGLLLGLHEGDARASDAAAVAAPRLQDQGHGQYSYASESQQQQQQQQVSALDTHAQRLRHATTTAARALAAANAGAGAAAAAAAAEQPDANGTVPGETGGTDPGTGQHPLFDAAAPAPAPAPATGSGDHRVLNDAVAIRAVGPQGLVPVRSEEEWERVKGEVVAAVWLEGCVKVLIEV